MEHETYVTRIEGSPENIRSSYLELTKMTMLMLIQEDRKKFPEHMVTMISSMLECAAMVISFTPGEVPEQTMKKIKDIHSRLLSVVEEYARMQVEGSHK